MTVIAQIFRGYDSYPVIEELHRQKRQLEQVRNGGEVLQLMYENKGATVRFIDSLSFFTMLLSAFPKTFGLRELKKGFFPHLFNTPTNKTYHGPLPAAEYDMPDNMTPSTRQEVDTWYVEQVAHQDSTGALFHFEEELKAYCRSDVRLLKEGCLFFMREFQSRAAFDPFEPWLRLAIGNSACIASLRTLQSVHGIVDVVGAPIANRSLGKHVQGRRPTTRPNGPSVR